MAVVGAEAGAVEVRSVRDGRRVVSEKGELAVEVCGALAGVGWRVVANDCLDAGDGVSCWVGLADLPAGGASR